MSITREYELNGMKKVGAVVSQVLRQMQDYAQPGMSTRQLDQMGGRLLKKQGAKSAPKLTYGFPGWTCISINQEIAHGVPSRTKTLKEGDLVNIDVSAELNGFWADNGCSFVLGEDIHHHQDLVETSKSILKQVIQNIRSGDRVALVGKIIETEANAKGYQVIRNLAGHGVGRSLHEKPHEIANYYNRRNLEYFPKNAVVAIETFIATDSTWAKTMKDGWTLVGNKGGFVSQHEHTLIVQENNTLVLTSGNQV